MSFLFPPLIVPIVAKPVAESFFDDMNANITSWVPVFLAMYFTKPVLPDIIILLFPFFTVDAFFLILETLADPEQDFTLTFFPLEEDADESEELEELEEPEALEAADPMTLIVAVKI
jgi:hypothetical protein